MKKTLLAALCVLFGLMSAHATNVNYTADDATIFSNPERGFLTQLTRHKDGSYNAVKGKESHLTKHANQDHVTLILVLYYLDEFNHTATLPQEVLTAFDEDMAVLRNYGMKAIFRIAYAEKDNGKSGSDRSAEDAPLEIIESHLAQYKPYWEKNADVIFTFQAGFVGQYGEWYYTDNFGNHVPTINDACRALLDTALKAIPQNRTLLLRRPMFKQEYLDGVALTAEEAYTGTAKARLGHFNDAFLYNDDNMGTYSTNETKRAAQKALIAQETLYVPLGGETDITDAEQAKNQASHDSTVTEMSTMHWTFIKNSYSETVTNMWRENGTFDELNRNMGYRYQLVNATLPEAANAGDKVSIALNIKNVGYAPLYNERPAYLVLKKGAATYSIKLATDPRRWLPNGVTTAINEQVTIPNSVPDGVYELYLNLPDAYESIASDPRYSVRFANAEVWDETSGMNSLLASITIGTGDTPEPEPEAIVLPATLNKANVTAYSDDMTWYNTDYFDYGPTDGHNLDRWAEWTVNLKYPGQYIISEIGYCENGHTYSLELMEGASVVSSFTAVDTDHWGEGDQSYTQKEKWDLSAVAKKVYTLRVKNATKWGRPKLKSLTLEYDGDIPSGIEETHKDAFNGQAFDILGRPVNASYHGIVIQNGKKRIQ